MEELAIPLVIRPLLVLAHGAETAMPLHAMLISFTAGLLPAAIVFDLLGTVFKKDGLRTAAWWTLLGAAIVTPLTAAAGWWWFLADPSDHTGHWQMPIHQWLGTALTVALIPAAIWRGRIYRRQQRPGWAWWAAATVLLAAVMVQGELGGSMFFGKGLFLQGEEGRPAGPGGAETGAGQHNDGGH